MQKGDARKKLVENSTQIFATKGFAATSIRELTKAAKVNISAVSYYFNSKGELYTEILEEQLSPILQVLQSEQKNDFHSPIERLTFFTNQIAHIHKQRPLLAKLIHNEMIYPTDFGGNIIKTYLLQLYQLINNILQEGICRGYFRTDLNVAYATIALSAIINFYFTKIPLTQLCAFFGEPVCDEYISQAFRVYMNGIVLPS